MPSDRVREILPPDTAATWDAIAPVVPPDAYLGDGTAIAVHLAHRVSRDLDFFFHHESIDLDKLTHRLNAVGPFAVTERSAGTLNGIFSATKVQFLHADESLTTGPGGNPKSWRPAAGYSWPHHGCRNRSPVPSACTDAVPFPDCPGSVVPLRNHAAPKATSMTASSTSSQSQPAFVIG
jgi:hypothetical protein